MNDVCNVGSNWFSAAQCVSENPDNRPVQAMVRLSTEMLGYALLHNMGFRCSPGVRFMPPFHMPHHPPFDPHCGGRPPWPCPEPPINPWDPDPIDCRWPFDDGRCCDPSEDWTVSNPGNGQATIDLGDDYEIVLNQSRSEMKLVNKCTGQSTDIEGDPHMIFQSGGQNQSLEFWRPVTLHLRDGTQITVNTTPQRGNGPTYASQLVITRGNRAIVVDGLNQNSPLSAGHSLSITQSDDGRCLRAITPDGLDLYEGCGGSGWFDSNGQEVSQAELDAARNQPVNNAPRIFFGGTPAGLVNTQNMPNPLDPAKGLHLSSTQKKALREQVENQQISETLQELAQDWSAQPPGQRNALWAAMKVRDADGKVIKLLVRIDSQGNYTVQKVDDWKKTEALDEAVDSAVATLKSQQALDPGKTVRQAIKVDGQSYLVSLTANGEVQTQKTSHPADTAAIDDAAADLQARWAATPPGERKKLSETIKVPSGDKYTISIDANGKVSAKKHEGFWGSFLHVLEDVVTPIVDVASVFVPALAPVAIGLSMEKGVHDMADGNFLGGALMFGGSVGDLIGGAAGEVIGDAVDATKGVDNVVNAVKSGNVFGAISSFAGVFPGMADALDDSGITDELENLSPTIDTAAQLAQVGNAAWSAAQNGNPFAAISGFAGILPDAVGLFGASSDLVDETDTVASKIKAAAGLAQVGDAAWSAAQRGNVLGAAEGFVQTLEDGAGLLGS